MRNAARAVLFLLVTTIASAAVPTVTKIEPNVGFVFAETRVTITGTNFSQTDVSCAPSGPARCPASVVFVLPVNGTLVEFPGTVFAVTPTTIDLLAPPRPHDTVADVKVRIEGQGEAVVARGFRWSESATSPNPADYVRYLLPVVRRDAPGANGSLWTTEWTLYNGTAAFAMIWENCVLIDPCPMPVIPAESTVHPLFFPRGDGTDGAFVYVPKSVAGRVGMSLRVRDLSRNAQSFGTEIPIPIEADYTNQDRAALQFLDIPTDPKYRATLRIYGPNEAPKSVTAAVYSESGALLETFDVELKGIVNIVADPFPLHPAYYELDPLTPNVRASGERVRIAVSAFFDVLISPPLVYPIWGMVTVTNNDTQQVTVVTSKR